MPLEKVLSEEKRKIEENSEREIKTLNFFVNTINSDYKKIHEAFLLKIDNKFRNNLKYLSEEIQEKGWKEVKKDFFEQNLLFEYSMMVKELNEESTKIIGITVYREKIKTPDIELGFCEYFKYEGINAIGKRLTKKGLDEINKYREINNLKSIEESKKINHARLKKISS